MKSKIIIKKLNSEEFYPLFKKYRGKIFKNTLSFSAFDVRTKSEKSKFENLSNGVKDRFQIHFVAYDTAGNIIGWSSSNQTKVADLYMMNSAVFPKYRRNGIYTKFVKLTLIEAKKLGFQNIYSTHVSTNNSVIIAKLKLGFVITGFELSDEFGLLVKLNFYLNQTRKEALDFRAGLIKPSKKLKALFKI